MSTHQRTIPINDLRPGMFICDVFNDKNVLLFSSNTFITGFHQIEYLRKQGVSSVTVIFQGKGAEKESEDSFEKYVEFKKQVKKAEAVRKSTLDAVRSMALAAKVGRYFSIKEMISQLQDLVTQMLEQPDVTIGVTQIKIIVNSCILIQ